MRKFGILAFVLFTSATFSVVEASEGQLDYETSTKFKEKFFKEMKTKDAKEKDGILVVDTINGESNEDTFEYDGIEVSKKAVIASLYEKSDKETTEIFKKIKKDKNSYKKEKLDKLEKKFKDKKVKYDKVNEEFEELGLYDTDKELMYDILPTEFESDPNDKQARANYYYRTVGTSYYEDFDENRTINGIYNKQVEY